MGKDLIKTEGALPIASRFVDVEGSGKNMRPAATLTNARVALYKLGVVAWLDLFTDKVYVGGQELNSEVGGQLTDNMVAAIRVKIREAFLFDPGKNHTWDAINLYARERAIHPVKDYLNDCFDQLDPPLTPPRIDTMLRDYFGAPDTPLVRAISRIVMVASVRRIFNPGCKFDYMTVLESREGTNKSSGLSTLYGPQWFSDQKFLGLDDKRLAEVLRGKWCVECSDLAGMRRAEVEDVKAQLSRQVDRVRPAYGRAVIETPRSSVFWGTTNDRDYMRSQTGNRRFLPVEVGRIDVDALARDRDLLWGEAMAAHKAGESVMLPESLWADAGAEQAARTYSEPWIDDVANVAELARHYMEHRAADTEAMRLGVVYQDDGKNERVTSAYVLCKVLGIPPNQQTAEHGKRLGVAMRKHDWQGPKSLRIGGRVVKGFERQAVECPPGDWE